MRRIKYLVAAAVLALAGFGLMPAHAQQVCLNLDIEVVVNGMPAGTGPQNVCVPPAG